MTFILYTCLVLFLLVLCAVVLDGRRCGQGERGVRREAGRRPPLSMGPGGSGLISPTNPAENFGGFMYREPGCMLDTSKLQLRAGGECWGEAGALDYLQWMRLYPPDEHLVEVSAEVRRIPAWQNGPCRLFPMVVWDIVP